jgi:AraC-like DNA-binding protein
MWHPSEGVLVEADTAVDVHARIGPLVMVLMERDTGLVQSLQRADWSIVAVPEATVDRWRLALGEPATLDSGRVDAWVRSEFPSARRQRSVHPHVRCVIRYLHDHELDGRSTSLACLARAAQLSPSRLMHVFTESVGIPLRRYLGWIRVRRAAAALGCGVTATEAAYLAGFADSAHLARTVRGLLGVTPRQLIALPERPKGRTRLPGGAFVSFGL